MDYDIFFEGDIDKKFFYTDYPGNKLVVGKINLKNAIQRLSKHEYYVLVTYKNGEELPQQYAALPGLTSDDGTLFASINPNYRFRFSDICKNGGIQGISQLGGPNDPNPKFLLGPGPDTVYLNDLIMEEYDKYYGKEVGRSK